MSDLTTTATTLCAIMGVEAPELASAHVDQRVLQASVEFTGKPSVQKCLIYNPDAIGRFLFKKHNPEYEKVLSHAPLSVDLRSIYPPKTPVCFASMYTGATPEIHGVQRYEKPVIYTDTIFDVMIRNNKKVAIVAVSDSSIHRLFLERKLDYFIEPDDDAVTDRALELLKRDEHDFIVVYHQEYDDTLHRTTPESEEALKAFRKHIVSFKMLAEAWNRHWGNYARVILFAPDHGGHINPETGHGDHGDDIPEDMEVLHFYGFGNNSNT